MALYTVNITDGTTLANLAVSAGRGPKGDGWTGVTYDNGTGRFTFTSTDGLGYVSDSITGDLDTAVTEAEAAQAAAEAAQAATENIFDQFGDQYLGPKASDPTVDNDGDPLTEGDIYFNTTDDVLKFYSGTAWVAPESIATTAANEAEASATAAATSETNAASSASAASTSETNAASSASAASTSETNAATSETNAASSASAASTSETNAAASETAAAASEAAAAASETAAATSESNAASSASAASTSASNAATSETNAASSASAASTSETNAANSASAAASSYDQFDDRYLGSKSSAPTVDNDGNALLTGALYWDSTLGGLYVWNSTSWEIAGQRDELLQAVAATKSDTAVDVFVYRTADDSDGGAWRKRTQGTSWYNETLNTATRGSRKEFPAVAVIVAENTQVTIYDGDDPSLPMWMVFNLDSSFMINLAGTTRQIKAVQFLNGIMVVPLNNGVNNGTTIIKFIEDFGYEIGAGYQRYGVQNAKIADRNVNATTFPQLSSVGIVSGDSNDVAMTVLPNAPIDAATGLPVPTIAVATAGGVSVIKDDGTVVDITGGIPNSISFTKENRLFFDCDIAAGGSRAFRVLDIPSVDTNLTLAAKPAGSQYYTTATFADTYPEDIAFLNGYAAKAVPNAIGFRNGTSHLALIAPKPDDNTKAMIAFVTSTYNTGWMNGDIKLATLSDTDDTDVTGSELVTNGTFDTDTSGWSATTATITYNSGVADVDRNGASFHNQPKAPVALVGGKTYTFSCDVTTAASEANAVIVILNTTADGDLSDQVLLPSGSTGTISGTVTAPSTGTYYVMIGISQSIAGAASFDNISVRLAEEDRSVNGKGLQVFGTVTKNPVASGADLVAYSSDGVANYLLQPYNSDLEFGTGDFCFMFWDDGTSGSYRGLVTFGDRGVSSTDGHGVRSGPSGNVYQFWANTSAQSSVTGVVGSWNHVTFVRRSGVLYSYLNGQLKDTDAFDHNLDTLTNPEMSVLYGDVIKSTTISVGVWTGSAALLRISATAPSPEAIKKIYEDEKVLFQENAKAVLHGTSDAVTALAFDDTTNLLHVGTSAGRSVFQGLRRVDNTTTGVTSAISASNGLVAEQ